MRKKPAILITAGPTREYIDSVRFISNASSGKMASALAREASRHGSGRITIIAGESLNDTRILPRSLKTIYVRSARDMLDCVMRSLPEHDIFISAAAVADYKPVAIKYGNNKTLAIPLREKIKKSVGKSITLKLSPTPDILRSVSFKKINSNNKKLVIVGFALEAGKNLFADAVRKLKSKKCDIIVGNETGALESDKSTGAIFFADGKIIKFKELPKKILAKKIITEALKIWRQRNR